MKTLFFKIKFGWGEDDFLEVPEDELYLATKAWIGKQVYMGRFGFLDFADKNIQGIVPDYIRMMGYYRGYKPSAGDYADMERSNIKNRAIALLESVKRKVRGEPMPIKKISGTNAKFFYINSVKDLDIVNVECVDSGEKSVLTIDEAQKMKDDGLLVQKPEEN